MMNEDTRKKEILCEILSCCKDSTEIDYSVFMPQNIECIITMITTDASGHFCEPNDELIAKIKNKLTSDTVAEADKKAANILKMLKQSVCNSDEAPVTYTQQALRSYSHPVDANVIQLLDRPLINGLFRKYVEFDANIRWGQVLSTGIPVTERTYPELDQIINECADTLHIKRPYVVITSSLIGINAVTFGSDSEPYIALSSLLLKVMSNDEMRFIIGHECGHIAMGHLIYHNAAQTMGTFLNWIPLVGRSLSSAITFPLLAWSRRSEITADRAGMICCGNLECAQRALIQIECGILSADSIDVETYLESSREFREARFLRRTGEYLSSHPLIPKRIEALGLFEQSKCYHELIGEEMLSMISDTELADRTEYILKVA